MSQIRVKDHRVQVCEVLELTPWYRRILFDADGLFDGFSPQPGGYLMVTVPSGEQRAYSLKQISDGQFIMDFVIHGTNGPGSIWAAQAGLGDEILVSEPPYHCEIPSVSRALFIADSSALLAATTLAESVDMDSRILFVDDHLDREQIPVPPNTTYVDSLTDVELTCVTQDLDPDDSFLWAAGERHLAKLVREFARESHLPRTNQHIQTYWILGPQ